MRRVKFERKSVKRTDSKLWRKQQSGDNNDTKHPSATSHNKQKKNKNDIVDNNDEDLNAIIKKILKKQSHLRSQILRLEEIERSKENDVLENNNCDNQDTKQDEDHEEEDVKSQLEERSAREKEGKGYILKTFLANVESEDFYSHDSGLGSALATTITTENSFCKDNEMKSLDTVLCDESNDILENNNDDNEDVSDQIRELVKLMQVNEKITLNETNIVQLSFELKELKDNINSMGEIELKAVQETVDDVTRTNSSKSHEIKKNDVAISHMDKNIQARQTFLNTIELDINRAESYAKRLQKEFEREFETVGLCQDILSSCTEEKDDTKDEVESESLDKEPEKEKEKLVEDETNLEEVSDSYFKVTASNDPFGGKLNGL